MKKFVFMAVGLAAMSFSGHAQKIKFGAKAGLNLSQFSGDLEKNNFRSGLNVGAVAEIKFNSYFSLQPELLYNRQGNKIIIDNFVGDYYSHEEYFDNLDYLSLPVLLKVYLFKGLSIEAGPQISLLTGAKRKLKLRADDGEGSIEVNVNSQYEKADFALAGGIAYDLPMGIFIQARYIGGISNITTYPDTTLKNQTLAFSAGYKF